MRLTLFLISLFVSSYVHSQSEPTFATLDIELAEGQLLPLSNSISFELVTSNADSYKEILTNWKNITVHSIDDNLVKLSMTAKSHFVGEVRSKHLDNSFVIDFEEDAVKRFVSNFKKEIKKPWTLEKIEAYVNNYIDKPTYIHGFKIASAVSKGRSGDCTEYAVLVAALARSLGLASRVVLGTVILEEQNKVASFGHAWAQIWFNGQWEVVDSALYRSKAKKHFYIPAGELENEGPGFLFSLYTTLGRIPKKINQLNSF